MPPVPILDYADAAEAKPVQRSAIYCAAVSVGLTLVTLPGAVWGGHLLACAALPGSMLGCFLGMVGLTGGRVAKVMGWLGMATHGMVVVYYTIYSAI